MKEDGICTLPPRRCIKIVQIENDFKKDILNYQNVIKSMFVFTKFCSFTKTQIACYCHWLLMFFNPKNILTEITAKQVSAEFV